VVTAAVSSCVCWAVSAPQSVDVQQVISSPATGATAPVRVLHLLRALTALGPPVPAGTLELFQLLLFPPVLVFLS